MRFEPSASTSPALGAETEIGVFESKLLQNRVPVMPIEDFHGETFVAFCDISGFKQYMKEPGKAALTLHNFYNGGYNILRNQAAGQTKVDGIFISDCAVMFSRPEGAVIQEKFHRMLHVVEQLNKAMLRHDLMLTTSIAYGHFDYTQRIEFEGIEKNLLMGNPYIEAYLDGSSGKPKLQPGECRLLHHHLPNGFLLIEAPDLVQNECEVLG